MKTEICENGLTVPEVVKRLCSSQKRPFVFVDLHNLPLSTEFELSLTYRDGVLYQHNTTERNGVRIIGDAVVILTAPEHKARKLKTENR